MLVRAGPGARPASPLPALRQVGFALGRSVMRGLATAVAGASSGGANTLLAGPPAATRDRSPERQPSAVPRWLALGLLVSAQFVVMADTSIVNVALPSLQNDLGLSPVGATWVVNSYVLAYGGLLLLSGRVGDLYGRRRMFVIGSLLFTAGTLLAAAATGAWLLVAGRIVQGLGASALSPAAMSLLMLSFPGDQRARAMSAWGAASTLGGMTGVVAGGWIADSLGWRAVFLVTVPGCP